MKDYKKEFRKERNNEAFIKHILSCTSIPDEKTAREYFDHLDQKHKDILVIRWGLDGTHKTSNSDKLILKTKNDDAPILYKEAERALKMQVFAESLVDYNLFSNEQAAALGLLAIRALHGKTGERTFFQSAYIGKKLMEILPYLDEKVYKVLWLRFGLDGLGKKNYKEIASLCDLSDTRIQQLETIGFTTLRGIKKFFLA